MVASLKIITAAIVAIAIHHVPGSGSTSIRAPVAGDPLAFTLDLLATMPGAGAGRGRGGFDATKMTAVLKLAAEKAGWGSAIMGCAAFLCLATAALSFTRGEKSITRSDWISFIVALFSILLWCLTKDPFYSVILITLIEFLGLYPTLRKSWSKPFEENISIYLFSAVRCVLSVFALDMINFNTAFYPAATCAVNLAFVVILAYRRRRLSSLLITANST